MCLSVLMDIAGNAQIDLIQDERKSSRFRTMDADVPDRNHGVSLEERHACARCSWGAW